MYRSVALVMLNEADAEARIHSNLTLLSTIDLSFPVSDLIGHGHIIHPFLVHHVKNMSPPRDVHI